MADLRLLAIVTGLVALCCAAGMTQDDPLEGVELTRHVLSDGENAAAWSTAECTAESSPEHVRSGNAVHMHIPVDFKTGEPNYPIGWPRMYVNVPEGERDWTGYDFLSVWIYSDTSREAFPSSPLGLIVRCPDRQTSYTRNLSELVKGEWSHIVTPIAALPNPKDCAAVQLYISESNYSDGDVLDFYIDDLELLAYAAPTVLELRPLNGVMYADAGNLRVQARVSGLAEDATAELTCALKLGDKTLAEEKLTAKRGVQSLLMNFGRGTLQPGECTLTARIEGSDRVVTVPIRVVSSPWE